MADTVDPKTEGLTSLAGHLLIATPVVQGGCFVRSVIYLCAHSAAGAMGIIVNYPVENLALVDILDHLNIAGTPEQAMPVHFGGPVEATRGFVIHSDDYGSEASMIRQDGIAVTSSIDVLQDIAAGKGPRRGMLVLGYAGWAPGQLEAEMESGSWILVPATSELVLGPDNDTKWSMALSQLGIDMGHYSTDVGHA